MGRKEFSWDGIYNFFRKWPWMGQRLINGDYRRENVEKRKVKAEGRTADRAGRATRRIKIRKQKEEDSRAK